MTKAFSVNSRVFGFAGVAGPLVFVALRVGAQTMATANVPGGDRFEDAQQLGSPPTVTPVSTAPDTAPETAPAAAPFGFADFTVDAGYNYEFSNPRDHTIVGTTAAGRHNELQITHLGIGGDFHYNGARGRVMTQLGLYSTMTPRSDASPMRGQWTLADAYKYITEGYGGYHFDVLNGINVDAGIFLSYVGLCVCSCSATCTML
jgi:hypothetical protein